MQKLICKDCGYSLSPCATCSILRCMCKHPQAVVLEFEAEMEALMNLNSRFFRKKKKQFVVKYKHWYPEEMKRGTLLRSIR